MAQPCCSAAQLRSSLCFLLSARLQAWLPLAAGGLQAPPCSMETKIFRSPPRGLLKTYKQALLLALCTIISCVCFVQVLYYYSSGRGETGGEIRLKEYCDCLEVMHSRRKMLSMCNL